MDAPAKKSLGQHWLDDAGSLEAICRAAEVGPSDTILEIGPGRGSLTEKLLSKGASVWAVEYDTGLLPLLKQKFANYPGTKLWVEAGDIRAYDLANLPPDYKIVANIPYYLTAYLLRLLADTVYKPHTAALLVQKEVAERAAAAPGRMGLLSVSTQFYYEVSLGAVVPASLFKPPPKVDSQILTLIRRPKPLFNNLDEKVFFRVVKAGFSQRRKTLLNSLSAGLRLGKDDAKVMIENAKLNPQTRPQELSLKDWYDVYRSIRS